LTGLGAVLALTALALVLGGLLGWAARAFAVRNDPVAERINALLPQTQCGQCGYPGCRPYAQAIAAGNAGINQCPPGGAATIRALADLLGREPVPLDHSHGVEKPPVLARIDEQRCIGCTLCIQACPVDAIVGAPKLMHTVVAEACTGCELCLPPCPVDCIDLVEPAPPLRQFRRPAPVSAPTRDTGAGRRSRV
jgi:electron transport complex protein RnfB